MAEQDILQNLISRLGQSQDDRLPAELGRHFVDVDERTPLDLLRRLAALASRIRFYSPSNANADGDGSGDVSGGGSGDGNSDGDGSGNSDGNGGSAQNWSSFFPTERQLVEALRCQDGSVPPHLGLLIAFLRLYDEFPRPAINSLTGRHLDFQYRDVLGFTARGARPDHAHLLLELKKGSPSAVVPAGHEFTAGKDARGVELVYRAVRDVVINSGVVADLKSVYHDGARLRCATRADSADGQGTPFATPHSKWRPFGGDSLSEAQVGFALASPVLRMAEGTRSIQVELQLAGLDPQLHTAAALSQAFAAYFSGPKGWVKAQSSAVERSGDRVSIRVTLSPAQPAFVDCDVALHGPAFVMQAPLLRLMLVQNGPLRYRDLLGLSVDNVRLRVGVDSLTPVEVENDFGKLNAKKAFQPFGPQPVAGATLQIHCDEALSKRWRRLEVNLTWQGAPPNLYEWYDGYSNRASLKNGVAVHVDVRNRGGRTTPVTRTLLPANSPSESTITIEGPALLPDGVITMALVKDFLHADYLRETVTRALATTDSAKAGNLSASSTILRVPYTPTVQAIRLSYEAETREVKLTDDSSPESAEPEVQFFHVDCFGVARAPAASRPATGDTPSAGASPIASTAGAERVGGGRVSLMPRHDQEGEFLIGVRGVEAGDSLSLLLQAAEGSGDPELPSRNLHWSVLCGRDWRALAPDELVLDTTRDLRTSGIVALSLPAATTTTHSIMPAGLVWLRATIAEHSAGTCQLVRVGNNAVEVAFADLGNGSERSSATVPSQQITKSRVPLRAVKEVSQPFASFGGRAPESNDMVTRRAAERLRHRQRCLTAWDYERMVLEAFPAISRVKCVPHASDHSWFAPGHVLLIVVPDLRNQNAVDPLQPRVDTGTIDQITDFVRRHCGMQVQIRVRNPRYQRVKVSCLVQFRPGLSFNHYRRQLDEALVRALSPWAFDAASPIAFGGGIQRSVLLNFAEELPFVDFVTEFQLTSPDSSTPQVDQSSVAAETPDAILVSAQSHAIEEYKGT